jgi:hypothetical protein
MLTSRHQRSLTVVYIYPHVYELQEIDPARSRGMLPSPAGTPLTTATSCLRSGLVQEVMRRAYGQVTCTACTSDTHRWEACAGCAFAGQQLMLLLSDGDGSRGLANTLDGGPYCTKWMLLP